MLVEDDELVASSIASVMHSRGVNVVVCSSAEEFIQNFTTQPQGTLILDIDLGPQKLSGIDLLRWLRNKHWNMPVIVLSGKVTVPQAVDAMRESVIDIIPKPPSIQRLLSSVQASFSQPLGTPAASTAELSTILESLPPLEASILELLLSGSSNKLIASRLDLGLRSAVRYRKTLLEAFGFKTITELANALGSAGIGPGQISASRTFLPTIPAQQRKEIRERLEVVANILREGTTGNVDQMRKSGNIAIAEIDRINQLPALSHADPRDPATSVLLVASDSQIGSLLRDLLRAYGFFAELCNTAERAKQCILDCPNLPHKFLIVLDSGHGVETISDLLSLAPESIAILISNNPTNSDHRVTVIPSPVRGLDLVRQLLERN